jgi:hypothetical protein
MPEPLHERPASIALTREEYRVQHAALEVALDVLDRFPATDTGGLIMAVATGELDEVSVIAQRLEAGTEPRL